MMEEYNSDNELFMRAMAGGAATGGASSRNNKYSQIGRQTIQYEVVDLEDNKVPICREIILKSVDIPNFFNVKCDPIIRHDVAYPKFSRGFNHWIHASKNKTEKFNTFEGKKKVYLVINGYERYIDDYNENIGELSKKFFTGLSKELPNILTRAFYKLWELFYYYDLINISDKNFVSAHLAEGPGSFIQATMFFRDMFASKESKNDKYHAITIHSENEDTSLDLEREFVQFYAKEKPQRFFMHKTYDSQTAGGSKTKDNGDLTKRKTLENFKKDIGVKVDLVTGDGGFEWDNENIQEQECAILIFGQILAAINIQKKGGHFILKIFETFTDLSAKFILLLKFFYEEVHINKPFTSRESNSERYLVCRKFKYDEKQISDIVHNMMDGLDDIDKIISDNKGKPTYLYDIFPSVKVPDDLVINMLSINTEITNQQFRVINKMIEFIEVGNYHGPMYDRYRNRQIELTKYWIDTFFDKDNAKARKLMELSAKKQKNEYFRFRNKLIGLDVPKEPVKEPAKEPVKETVKEPEKKPKVISRSKAKTKTNTKSKSKSKTPSKPSNKKKTKK